MSKHDKALRQHGGPVVHEATETQPTTYESDCYVTPAETVALVREAFGGTIDVDPFAGDTATHATVNFRYPQQDGLKDSWGPPGTRAYVNPPFSGEWKKLIINKIVAERARGIDTILLLPSGIVGSEAGEMVLGQCDAACFLSKRVRFFLNGKRASAPRNGTLLIFFGCALGSGVFARALDRLGVGVVLRRLS